MSPLLLDDEALARQLAHEEEAGARDLDEELARALARDFEREDAERLERARRRQAQQRDAEQANAQMEAALMMAAAAQDFNGIALAAATAAGAGLSPEVFLSLTGLGELLLAEPGLAAATRPEPAEEPPVLSQDQVRRLPTRTASAQLLEEECPICFASYEEGDELRTLPCLHAFHTECIDQWLTSRRSASSLCCPVCHTKVDL